MRKLFFISSLIITIFGSTCTKENSSFNINCDECYYIQPDSANLVVNITINSENPSVPLVFYRGKVEDGIIEWVDTSSSPRLELYSPVNDYYSVEAIYKNGDKIIIAIDGTRLKLKHVSDVCDRDCWIITGGILDVRLK